MEGLGDLLKRSAAKERNSRLHSEAHALADEISAYFGERKKFAMYLGIIKRIGVPEARSLFARIRSEETGAEDPRKLFMWLTRARKPGGGVAKDGKP